MAYCCLILVGKLVQKLVFGELRVSEKQVRPTYVMITLIIDYMVSEVSFQIHIACKIWIKNVVYIHMFI